MNCRFDGKPITTTFADLYCSPLSNGYLKHDQLSRPETYFPLRLRVSDRTFLVQTDNDTSVSDIFNDEYAYFSSFSKSWLFHARNYVTMVKKRFNLNQRSFVVELASNDGYLLQYMIEEGIPCLGIEPSANTAAAAKEKGVQTWVNFFGKNTANDLVNQGFKADLLLGNNVLAHAPDINDFVGGLKIALKPTGVITMEFPHLMEIIKYNQFDTIYHEHFFYFSLYSVKLIFEKHKLEIFDVEQLSTHGGSLRIYAKHKDAKLHHTTPNVQKILKLEETEGMHQISYYKGFQKKINEVKYNLLSFLLELKRNGRSVCAYGAAAKGNTLLNYSGVTIDLLPYVVDASPHKQGKYMPGSHIPIVSEESIEKDKPDFIIIFPWNILDEITTQLHYTRRWGAKFVTAIPELRVF